MKTKIIHRYNKVLVSALYILTYQVQVQLIENQTPPPDRSGSTSTGGRHDPQSLGTQSQKQPLRISEIVIIISQSQFIHVTILLYPSIWSNHKSQHHITKNLFFLIVSKSLCPPGLYVYISRPQRFFPFSKPCYPHSLPRIPSRTKNIINAIFSTRPGDLARLGRAKRIFAVRYASFPPKSQAS